MRKRLWVAVFFIVSSVLLSQTETPLETQTEMPMPMPKVHQSAVGIKIGGFGIPNSLLDMFLYEHPNISGNSYAFEIRTYGEKGPKSIFSGVFAIETNKMKASGKWRAEQYNRILYIDGEVSQVNITATILMSIFPSLAVHPYIGAGIGIGKASIWSEGVYKDELGIEIKETFNKNYLVPVGHLPIGIMVNIMNKFEIRLEGGFKNGFYIGGSVAYYF